MENDCFASQNFSQISNWLEHLYVFISSNLNVTNWSLQILNTQPNTNICILGSVQINIFWTKPDFFTTLMCPCIFSGFHFVVRWLAVVSHIGISLNHNYLHNLRKRIPVYLETSRNNHNPYRNCLWSMK